MTRLLIAATLALTAMLAVACAWQPMVGSQVVYTDPPVDRGEPEFYFNTRILLNNYPKAVVYPFVVRQKMNETRYVGQEVARIVAQTWMREQTFPEIRYDNRAPDLDERRWSCLGLCQNASIVVTGEVLYYLDGGSSSNSAVSLRVVLRAAGTGEPILVMEHSGRLEAGFIRDYMVATARNRLPESPPYAITFALAQDMAHFLKQWGSGSTDIRHRPLSSYYFP